MRFFTKRNADLPSDAAVPRLGTHPEKTVIRKHKVHPDVHSSAIYDSQYREVT